MLAAHTLTIGPGGGTICVDNSATWKGALVGSGTLTKSGYTGAIASPLIGNSAGAGSLVLSSDSPGFNGNFIVNAGSLIAANSNGSATGSGAVSVASGATLGGTGNFAGPVTINAGAHLAPGSSAGTLSVGSLNLTSNAVLDYDLSQPGDSDRTVIANPGSLVLTGGTVNITALSGFGVGQYTLLDYAVSFSGSASNLALGSAPPGFFYSFVNNAATTSIDVIVTVPEPGGMILACAGIFEPDLPPQSSETPSRTRGYVTRLGTNPCLQTKNRPTSHVFYSTKTVPENVCSRVLRLIRRKFVPSCVI
jgi:fibronectin-binding autotransporter adhesin